MISTVEIIQLVITGVSAIDFLIFSALFVMYLGVIPYKAQTWTTRVVAVCVILLFLTFKCIHIPAFLAMTPIVNFRFPYAEQLLVGLTWTNLVLAFCPLVAAVVTMVRKCGCTVDNDMFKDKQTMIVMPIYNEEPVALWNAIQSVRNLEYNPNKIHLYLAFDDDTEPEAWEYIMMQFGVFHDIGLMNQKIIELDERIRISVCRFPHGGKKSAQAGAIAQIKKEYGETLLRDALLFFIDSDIVLKPDALWQFVKGMTLDNKNCMTGLITCITSEKPSFLAYYQDIEYVSGQIMWRNLEHYFGATSCLPGAFTIMKWTLFDTIADKYFSKTSYTDSFEYQRFYLGEDRYLTHLIMEHDPWKIGFCEAARCKTEAPTEFGGLLKQRRRWFLGHISNDTWMLTSLHLWQMYPLLTLFNFLNNSRNTSIYIYLLYFVLLFNTSVNYQLWLLYVIVPILLHWAFLVYYAIRLRRKMNMVFYIVIILLQPIMSMVFMYYTIANISTRSWGGVRVDKSKQLESVQVQ